MPRFIVNLRGLVYKHYDFIMLLAFTLIVFITKTPIINSSSKLTKNAIKHGPLFLKSSSVVDYPSGNIRKALSQNRHADILVIYFYAPWDAQCRKYSSVFERVSDVYKDEVSFIAVNCWEPSGSCAIEGSLNRYPAIALYTRGLLPIVYDGPMRADYLTAFVHKAYYPLKVIHSQTQLQYIFSRYDNIVAAYFNFTASVQPAGFYQFYAASMKLLSRSAPSRHTVMAVILDEGLALKMKLNASGAIGIFKLNKDPVFPENSHLPWRASQIWLLLQQQGILQVPTLHWLQSTGLKSRQLDAALSTGPAALFFMRHNPLSSVHHHEAMVRELARLYTTCPGSAFSPNQRHLVAAREADRRALATWRAACSEWQALLASMGPSSLPPCAAIFASPSANRCSVCGDLTGNGPGLCHGVPATCFVCSAEANRALKAKAVQLFQRVALTNPVVDLPTTAADPFVDGMRQRVVARKCRELELSDQLRHEDAHSLLDGNEDLSASAATALIGGHGCSMNRSVKFFALDHGVYPELPRRLGLKDSDRSPLLALVDWKNEATYSFTKSFSYSNIAQFLSDFHAGRLRPSIKEQASQPVTGAPILDLTSHSASRLLRNNEQDVVVLFYSPSCGFCALFYHMYLLLAQYFSNLKFVVFSRINVSANDLPWELRVERLPTIVVFPSVKSNRAPSSLLLNQHKTLHDLVAFVLQSTSSQVFVQSLRHTCSSQCLQSNRLRVAEHKDRLQQSLRISESLVDTALPRLDWLNSKRNGLLQFRAAVAAWDDWLRWSHEWTAVSRELRALLGFVLRRQRFVQEYREKVARVSRLLTRLTGKTKGLDGVWQDVMGDL